MLNYLMAHKINDGEHSSVILTSRLSLNTVLMKHVVCSDLIERGLYSDHVQYNYIELFMKLNY